MGNTKQINMGNSEEQKAIQLLKDLVSLQNGAPLERDREVYESTMQEIYDFLNFIESPNYVDSHSPDPVSDTLQEGDYFIGTEEQYRKVLEIARHDFKSNFENGMMFFGRPEYKGDSGLKIRILEWNEYRGVTQLTPEEFLRRAENTFKNKEK